MFKAAQILFLLLFSILSSQAQNNSDINFIKFINKFKITALNNGIKKPTLDLAFKGITSPYPNTLTFVKNQPEFNLDMQTYLKQRVTSDRIAIGKQKKIEFTTYLKLIEKKFGVDQNIVLAIWANETNYGSALQNPKTMKDAIKALTSLAYYKSHYNKYAQKQLLALLKILQKHYLNRDELKSSWAGAIGQTQFIPTSYLLYAQDLDHDGKYDINTVPDALATTANLLAQNGWLRNQDWLYEIDPKNVVQPNIGATYPLNQWKALNLHKKDGSPLPFGTQKAKLIKIDGTNPAYILTMHNFEVIKSYNNSLFYALSVGLLANALKN